MSDRGLEIRDEAGWRVLALKDVALDDLTRIEQVEAACLRELEQRPARYAAVDLSMVNYLVTRAFGFLLALLKRQRERGGALVLCVSDANVRRAMRIARFDKLFDFAESVPALVAERPNGRPIGAAPPDFGP